MRGGEPLVADILIPGYDLRVIDRFDGLPSPTVRAISLDEDGSMWLGTYGGLSRYDGLQFRSFPSAATDGLEGGRIVALHLDRSGCLWWVGADRAPLSRFRQGSFEVVAPIERLASVGAILEATDGTVWFGGDRLARWAGGRLETFDLGLMPLQSGIRGPVEAPDGSILVACDGVVLRVPRGATSAGEFQAIELGTEDDGQAAGFFVDRRGHIWATSFLWDSIDMTADVQSTGIGSMGRVHGSVAIKGGLDPLSTDLGLYFVSRSADGGVQFDLQLTDHDTRAMLETDDGTIWIGAETFGLLQLRPREYALADLGADQGVMGVSLVPREGEDEVLALRLDGVAVLTSSRGSRPVQVSGAPEEQLWSVCDALPDRDGQLWVATGGGVARLDGDTIDLFLGEFDDTRCIVAAADGSIWFERGLAFHELLVDERESGRSTAPLEFRPCETVTWPGGFACVVADRVYALETASLAFSELVHLPDVEMRALSADPDGTLWITSYGDGLWRRAVPQGARRQRRELDVARGPPRCLSRVGRKVDGAGGRGLPLDQQQQRSHPRRDRLARPLRARRGGDDRVSARAHVGGEWDLGCGAR